MELRHLRYFIAVAEELHFGRAAARVGIAQPSLSEQIRNLEEELGVTLLERRTRREVRLTAAGEAFLAEARATLLQAERAKWTARGAAEGLEGQLAVGFVATLGLGLVPRLLRAFEERFPRVRLAFEELRTREQLARLRAGTLHVGLMRPPPDRSGLHVEPLLEEPLVAAVPEAHPLARNARIALAELARETVVVSSRTLSSRRILEVLQKQSERPLRVVEQGTELPARLELVAAGLGVTLVPEAARALRHAGVAFRPLDGVSLALEVALVRPAGPLSPAVRHFCEVAHEVVAGSVGGKG